MNKFFTTLLLVVCLSTASFAQKTKGETEFGANIGLNMATVTASNGLSNDEYRFGFNAGISADYYFSSAWSIKGKLNYDQKGWSNGFLAFLSGGSITTDYKLDYLTIPVLANWHFGRTRNWYLNFGPYVGILLSAKESATNMDLKPAFNTVDGGLDLGIGVKFPISDKSKLFIELNGQGGISDILKNNTGASLRNSVSAINVGINF